MTHITNDHERGRGCYFVNGKPVDTKLPRYGKNLEAKEYRALLNYLKCVEIEERRQVEDENRHLFD